MAKSNTRLRAELEAEGHDAATIEQIISERRERHRQRDQYNAEQADIERAHRSAQLREQAEAKVYAHVDDRGHKPARHDPLTTGLARATGPAAIAVKRRKALTRHEWDQLQGTGS